ncbi:MFS transporter [Thermomonospora cellulosilytica]|uniref:MFS family permease n=1 Tax=Thermomonospora cellulosilytica TaxID=1411118 RepID=A0A7W3MY88_9ACTN|nr:MFS transporter [Thermomonospora cellulosilytica]MBA9004086.1 MFS family permease [Thermomonospora cellulosilytica]
MDEADGRRWVVLAVGLGATIAGCMFQYGLPYLIPALRRSGLSLGEAGLVVVCPTVGLMAALIAWGAAADRWGERIVLSLGLGAAGAALLAAAAAQERPALMGACLVAAGAGGASVHAAGGRLILGWFAARERGLAMGLRQTSTPLGIGLAALLYPPLAGGGLGVPLLVTAVCCAAAAGLVALLVRDPRRDDAPQDAARTAAPYRTPVLWRLHAASALLVVPQFTVGTFALVFLIDEHRWDAATAGRALAAVAVAGAAARIAAGIWSDRAGTRLRPLRLVAAAVTAVMAALAAGTAAGSPAAVAVLLVAGVITVSPNGLAFTAVAEHAGRAWAGRALGVQNTAQNAMAVLAPPAAGALIGGTGGYPLAFAVAAAFGLAAVPLVPAGTGRIRRRASTARARAGRRRPARPRSTASPSPTEP